MSSPLPQDVGWPTRSPERQNLYLGIQAVDVFVRDLELSVEFYVNQLGFKVVSDVILQSGQRRVGVAPPDGTAVINLLAPDAESEEFKLIGRPTQVVFVTDDVAAKYVEWRKRGVRFRHTPRLRRIKYQQQAPARLESQTLLFGDQPPVWGGVFTRFEDPDHNSFGLVSLDEVSRAIEAQRRAAQEKREAERRAARDLEIAKEVQLRLFPQTLPSLRTLEYAGVCHQARQVGGDYYDFLSLGQERLGLVLGDISGKGIAAALLMANFQANLRTQYAMALDEPQRFLQSVNQLFYENTPANAYACLFFGVYDDQTRRLCCAPITPWIGSIPPAWSWDSSESGRVPWRNAASLRETSLPSTLTALPNPATAAEKNSGKSAWSMCCAAIVNCGRSRCSTRLCQRSGGSALTNRTTTSR